MYMSPLNLVSSPSQDFKEQIIHHLATIVLLCFSWRMNYVRAGTLVMLLHDSSDYFLEVRRLFTSLCPGNRFTPCSIIQCSVREFK